IEIRNSSLSILKARTMTRTTASQNQTQIRLIKQIRSKLMISLSLMIKKNNSSIINQTTATSIIISQILTGSYITNIKIIEKRIVITVIKKDHNRSECKYENYVSQSDE